MCFKHIGQDMPNLEQSFIFCLFTDDNGVAISAQWDCVLQLFIKKLGHIQINSFEHLV